MPLLPSYRNQSIDLPSKQPNKCHCCPHIETTQLICQANQLTGFYMTANNDIKWVKNIKEILGISKTAATIN